MPIRTLLAAVLLVLASASTASAQRAAGAAALPADVDHTPATIMSEGSRLAADLFWPKASAAERLPTIVMSHGWGGEAVMLRRDAVEFLISSS